MRRKLEGEQKYFRSVKLYKNDIDDILDAE
jgi:hypothetical protein